MSASQPEPAECDAIFASMALHAVGTRAYIVITMKARLVQIGNSRGIRLPKAVIEQVGLDDEVELRVEEQRLVIIPVTRARAGWAEAIEAMGADSASQLDPATPTRFDETEWRW